MCFKKIFDNKKKSNLYDGYFVSNWNFTTEHNKTVPGFYLIYQIPGFFA